jgi:hypothetical protein
MRVSPTSEQLEYLASLGVAAATPPVRTTRRSSRREYDGARVRSYPQTPRLRALRAIASGLCSAGIGLALGGFYLLITHGVGWGLCLTICTAIGWLMIGFLWTFGLSAGRELDQRIGFFKPRVGIRVAMVLAAIAFVICFVAMLLAVMISGPAAARAWIRGTLLVIWAIGSLPGLVLTAARLIQAQRR